MSLTVKSPQRHEKLVYHSTSLDDAPDILQTLLKHPDFVPNTRPQIIESFKRDVAKFDLETPPRRATQIKRLYKELKQEAPESYPTLKLLRMALAEFDDDLWQSFRSQLPKFLMVSYHSPQERQAVLVSFFSVTLCEMFVRTVIAPECATPLAELSYERICQDPVKCCWSQRFALGYALLRSYIDNADWLNALHITGNITELANVDKYWSVAYIITCKVNEKALQARAAQAQEPPSA